MPDRQPYVKRENRLIREWLEKTYPDVLQWKNVRLGPYPGSEQDKTFSSVRRWVDIVFKKGDKVHLVEAKMRPMPDALAQLEIYLRLWPQTPEFAEFKDLPVEGIFLTTRRDDLIESLAAEKGIRYETYSPAWVDEYWKELIARGK